MVERSDQLSEASAPAGSSNQAFDEYLRSDLPVRDVGLSWSTVFADHLRPQHRDRIALGQLLARGLLQRQADGTLLVHPELVELAPVYALPADRPWSATETEALRTGVAAGEAIGVIADRLARPWRVVRDRLGTLGLLPHQRRADHTEVIRTSATWTDAARRAGMSDRAITRWGQRHGVLPDRSVARLPRDTLVTQRMADRDQAILAAAQAGMHQSAIARQVGMSAWGVHLVLERHRQVARPVADTPAVQARRAAVRAAMAQATQFSDLMARLGPGYTRAVVRRIVMAIDAGWIRRTQLATTSSQRQRRRAQMARLRMALACRQVHLTPIARQAGLAMEQPHTLIHSGIPPAALAPLARVLAVPEAWLADGVGPNPAGIHVAAARAWANHPARHQPTAVRERDAQLLPEIERRLDQGQTRRAIAAALGVPVRTIQRCARRLGRSDRRSAPRRRPIRR